MRKAYFRVMGKKSIKRWPVFTVFSLFHGSNIVKYWQCWRVEFCLVISLCAVLNSLRTGSLGLVRQSWRGRVLARWRLRCNKSFPELTQVNLLLRLYYSNAWNSALAHFKMPSFCLRENNFAWDRRKGKHLDDVTFTLGPLSGKVIRHAWFELKEIKLSIWTLNIQGRGLSREHFVKWSANSAIALLAI